MRGLSRRSWLATLALVIGVGGPLAFGWFSGRSAALAEADALRKAPRSAAREAGERIAGKVLDRLDAMVTKESERPYFHYQNFFVDPRGAYAGTAVVPSPLSDGNGASDPLVLAYFQIDQGGVVTMPSVPEGIEDAPAAKPADVALLDALRHADIPRPPASVALALASFEAPAVDLPSDTQVASNDLPNVDNVQGPVGQGALGNAGNVFYQKRVPPQQAVQEVVLDPEQYAQNVSANQLYNELNARKNSAARAPQQQAALPAPDERAAVVVRMGPLAWETLTIAGVPSLAALRHIITPEGVRSQGFVLSRDALAELTHDGDVQARLVPPGSPDGQGVEVALTGTGWRVQVPSGTAEAAAEVQADALVSAFQLRFAGMGLLALLALAAVVIALVQADRHLERRQRFAAAAAHELRTPLAGLRMYAEMIALGLGKPEKHKLYAERLATEAGRLGRVVANVLDFTRMERGNLSVRTQDGDLVAAVEEQLSRLEPAIRAAGASIALESGDRPVTAAFDSDALAQILANLVDNAEKYGRESLDRHIVVSVERGAAGPEVHVKDRGPGLRAGFEARLFRPFARGDERDGPAGLGLGLALTRALARAQQGDIRFMRRVGGGAEFVVTLSGGSLRG